LRHRTDPIVLLLLAVPTVASAQAPAARGAYVGVGLGSLAYEIRADGDLFFDTTSRQAKLYGGFRLTRHWRFEFSYAFSASTTEPGLPASVSEELIIPGLAGPLVATTTARIEIATLRGLRDFRRDWGTWYLGAGVSGAAVDTTFDISGVGSISANIRKSKNGLTLATGAEWTWSSLVLRLEYEWWDADMSGVGLSLYRRL
jgi:opacity protein-like surface antigen